MSSNLKVNTILPSSGTTVTVSGISSVTSSISAGSSITATTFYGSGTNLTGIDTDLVSDTSPQLGGNLDVNTKNILFGDSGGATDDRLIFGAGTDMSLYHDGNNSVIENATGDLYIQNEAGNTSNQIFIRGKESTNSIVIHGNGAVELYDQSTGSAVKRLETTSSGIYITGSAELSNTLTIGGELNLTAGSAATRYIDAFVGEAGTFALRGTNNADSSGHQVMMEMRRNAGVHLNYSGSTKFQTTATGIRVDNANGNGEIRVRGSEGNGAQIYMDADDADDNEDQWRLDVAASDGSFGIQNYGDGAWEKNIECNHGAAVELYHDNSRKLYTSGHGIVVEDDNPYIVIQDSDTASGTGIVGWIEAQDSNGNSVWKIGNTHNDQNTLWINQRHNASTKFTGAISGDTWEIYGNSGHFTPCTDNTFDIGESNRRVRNIYTADLHCSNRGSSNDVDGTWGDYTIQEGESDLFLINNRSGKKYKFNLTEVN